MNEKIIYLLREFSMKTKVKYLLPFYLSVFLIISVQINSTQVSSVWNEINQTLVYDYQKTDTIYDDIERIVEIHTWEDTYRFWNFSIDENQLTFRTNKYSKALDQLFHYSDEGYNYSLYRRFQYDPKTDSIILGFEFNKELGHYYLIDGLYVIFANYFDCYLPLDLINIYLNNYYWDGIYGVVIPVNFESFVFKSDYSEYYENFSNINFQYDDSLEYLGRQFKGHFITISFTGKEFFGSTVITEDHYLNFKYAENGVLLSFKVEGKMFSNISNVFQLEKTFSWKLNLQEDSISKTSLQFLFPAFFIIILNLLFKRRKQNHREFKNSYDQN